MSRIQTRKTISMTPGTYEELGLLAQRAEMSMSGYLQMIVHEKTVEAGVQVDHDDARQRTREYLEDLHERKAADVERRRAEAFG
jgi:hypothetical protein